MTIEGGRERGRVVEKGMEGGWREGGRAGGDERGFAVRRLVTIETTCFSSSSRQSDRALLCSDKEFIVRIHKLHRETALERHTRKYMSVKQTRRDSTPLRSFQERKGAISCHCHMCPTSLCPFGASPGTLRLYAAY